MIRLWKFTLFFLLCLVVALLFNLPIQQVLPYVKVPDTVRLVGIDGTIVRGKAQEISVNQFPVRDIDYRYLPSCIPLLKVCYRVTYEQGTIQVAYDLLNGDTEVSGARIEYPVVEIVKYLPNLPVQPAGRVELLIDDLAVIDGKPTALNGKLIWRDLGLDDSGIKLNIGDYQVDFTGNPQKYDFKLIDLDASLDVDGEGEVDATGLYTVDIRIESETGIDQQVKSVLNLVAKSTGYNKYRIEQAGRLPPDVTRQLFR
ncbi:MAG: type II secretion system protein N [Gammaproteobacteria bacterium]|nr:type II secretion system protein N [Gammaproteobacteria bacterium]MDH3537552.1 type II secretion system protein N [Gammaproteobacteria bacterium]